MKKLLFLLFAFTPLALFASDSGAETDIVQRTVNFIIFAAILYYLLADKLKAFFAERSESIQSELDKVQETLKASKAKVDEANLKLEEAKVLAAEIVDGANADIDTIKSNVAKSADNDIVNLEKHFNEKVEVETRKAKREVVSEVLEELFNDDKLSLSQNDLSNIILKKVA